MGIFSEHKKMFLGIITGILAAFCFAIQGILAKLAYQDSVSTISLLTMRYIIALPIFWLFTHFKCGLKKAFNVKIKSIIFCCSLIASFNKAVNLA